MSGSKGAAGTAIVLGALALVAIPAGVVAAQLSSGLRLLQTLYVTVPLAGILALAALLAARRARLNLQRSLHPERRRLVRWARIAAWAGLYAAVTGALALGVYGVLRWAQT